MNLKLNLNLNLLSAYQINAVLDFHTISKIRPCAHYTAGI